MTTKQKDIACIDESYTIRCPRLGHMIDFLYCQTEKGRLPCFKILDCWHEHFPVEQYLKQTLTSEQWDAVISRPQEPKMLSLLQLIEDAKKRNKETT
ncbi:MAG: hypothetical protein HKM93_18180 [Desulfobacteraceae bacterium]|nr:hypothetical protein [Desulfobacteraceae bacterium]